MNQAAQQNPPSRRTKEELKGALEIAEAEKQQAAEQVDLLRLENERMLQDLARLRGQSAQHAATSTTAIAAGDIQLDPVTHRPLVPPLSEEELEAQDAELANQYEDMMPEAEEAGAIKPIATDRAARLQPVSIRKSLETDERDTGHHGKSVQFLEAAGEEPKLTTHAREVDVWAAKQKDENLAFMRQMVTIHIQHVNDRQQDKIFSIGVNGRQWSFERNREYTVPRYVVEGLLRAKPMTYGNEEYTKPNGERDVRWPIQQGCRYPFALVRDTYPKAFEWMRYVMAQPD